MKKHVLLTLSLTIVHGFAVFGRLINKPINQYAHLGDINATMSCSSTLGSDLISWFLIQVSDTDKVTIASGSTVEPAYIQLYSINQTSANESNLIILNVNDSTSGKFGCSDNEGDAEALLVVYHDLRQDTNASDNLPIGNVIIYRCILVYHENPFFLPKFHLVRFEPSEEIDSTSSPQLDYSSSLITATAYFYQTVSCLSFLNIQCVLDFGEPVGNLSAGPTTNAPSLAIEINFDTVKKSCPPSIIGATSGATLYLGGMFTCQLTVARPVSYSWTDLTYGNSSIGPQLTVWHDGSYECMALINSSGTWSLSATAVYNLTVENTVPSVTCKPSYGPIAGGTKVTLTLENWSKEFSNITAIYLGDSLKSTDLQSGSVDNNFVITTPNATAALIGQPLPITVAFAPGQYNISTNLSFTYRGNPEITGINPSTFVVTGGIIVTVTGTQLSSVANPLIQVTIVVERGENITSNKSMEPCEVNAEDSGQMTCRMPPVNIPDDFLQVLDSQYNNRNARDTKSMKRLKVLLSRRKRYANALSVTGPNGKDKLNVYLGFTLDGYPKYDNINDVRSDIQIGLNSPPEITSTEDIVEFDPDKDESISIKGKYMQRGCRITDYVVHVGADVCENIDLTDNQLSCRPPKQQPQLTQNGTLYCDQLLSIFIKLGFRNYQYACLKYSSRLPVLTIGLAVGLSSFVIVIFLIIVIVCCCKRSRNRTSKPTDNTVGRRAVLANEAYEPPSEDRLYADGLYLQPSVQSLHAIEEYMYEPSSDQL